MTQSDQSFVMSRLMPREDITMRDAVHLSQGAYGRHQLVWDAFPDGARRPLFRETEPLQFLVVSDTVPRADRHGWRIDTKAYSPQVHTGMRLEFSLRANATVCRDGKRHDIVTDARVHQLKRGETDLPTALVTANEVGPQWLASKGERCGFELVQAAVTGLRHHKTKKVIQFTTLDFHGVLRITDTEWFLHALFTGIGRAKGFGAGLLLVKRCS